MELSPQENILARRDQNLLDNKKVLEQVMADLKSNFGAEMFRGMPLGG
jgi:hypothetical protein